MAKLSIKEILSGNVLSHGWFKHQYKLILLISLLIFIYIYSGYQSERQQHRLSDLEQQLEDVQMTQLTISASLMDKTRQSSISTMLQSHGSAVKESTTPAIRVE